MAVPNTLQKPLVEVCGSDSFLAMHDNAITSSGRDRDLVHVTMGGRLAARFAQLQGGANAVIASLGCNVVLECCNVSGYSSVGVLATAATMRLVGSRIVGAQGSVVGLEAIRDADIFATGCYVDGHACNLQLIAGSRAQLRGCVLGRSDSRYGLALQPGYDNEALLQDCELGHPVQVMGGRLELEGCTLALGGGSPYGGAVAPDAQLRLVRCHSAHGPVAITVNHEASVFMSGSSDVVVQRSGPR